MHTTGIRVDMLAGTTVGESVMNTHLSSAQAFVPGETIVTLVTERPGEFFLVQEVRPDGYLALVSTDPDDEEELTVGMGEVEIAKEAPV